MGIINLIPAPAETDAAGNALPYTRSVLRELGPTDNRNRETFFTSANIGEGVLVYQITSGPNAGTIAPADASVVGTASVAGITLRKAHQGGTTGVISKGKLAGYDLSSVAVGSPVYLSDTTGKLDTTPGTIRIPIGTIRCLTDPARTKYLAVDIPQNQDPQAP